MFNEKEMKIVKEYLKNTDSSSRVYLGCDSLRFKKKGKWKALYTVVVVVHISSRHGCKIFGYSEIEDDYDKQDKPTTRLFNEAVKVTQLYNAIEDYLYEVDEVEIHLDVNPSKLYASNSVVGSAVGYVRGLTGISPKIKPASEAFASSCAADYMVRNRSKLKNL